MDSLVHKRITDIENYKNKIDKDENSIFYKRFYNESEIFWSQKELNDIANEKHFLHDMFKGKGTSILTVNHVSRIKIKEVFDSTATAIIYKPRNPHISIDIGDYINY